MKKVIQNISLPSTFRFVLPSVGMFLFFSFYTMVDRIFVGKHALASVNIAYPFISLTMALGTMLATGGNAVIAKKLGEQNKEQACKILLLFSLRV